MVGWSWRPLTEQLSSPSPCGGLLRPSASDIPRTGVRVRGPPARHSVADITSPTAPPRREGVDWRTLHTPGTAAGRSPAANASRNYLCQLSSACAGRGWDAGSRVWGAGVGHDYETPPPAQPCQVGGADKRPSREVALMVGPARRRPAGRDECLHYGDVPAVIHKPGRPIIQMNIALTDATHMNRAPWPQSAKSLTTNSRGRQVGVWSWPQWQCALEPLFSRKQFPTKISSQPS